MDRPTRFQIPRWRVPPGRRLLLGTGWTLLAAAGGGLATRPDGELALVVIVLSAVGALSLAVTLPEPEPGHTAPSRAELLFRVGPVRRGGGHVVRATGSPFDAYRSHAELRKEPAVPFTVRQLFTLPS